MLCDPKLFKSMTLPFLKTHSQVFLNKQSSQSENFKNNRRITEEYRIIFILFRNYEQRYFYTNINRNETLKKKKNDSIHM